jgi:UDP-N-acetyl-D-glucosamine dehydrogenase
MVVASQLLDLGAVVSAVDPHVVEDHVDRRIRRAELTAEELAAADAVVILTDHDQFDADLVEKNARYVLDTRRFVRGALVEHL